jgi:hypothetical protein
VPPISYVLVCERVQGAVGSNVCLHELRRAVEQHVQTFASTPERRAFKVCLVWRFTRSL